MSCMPATHTHTTNPQIPLRSAHLKMRTAVDRDAATIVSLSGLNANAVMGSPSPLNVLSTEPVETSTICVACPQKGLRVEGLGGLGFRVHVRMRACGCACRDA